MSEHEDEQRDYAEEDWQATAVAEENRGEQMGEIIERAYEAGVSRFEIVKQFEQVAIAVMARRTQATDEAMFSPKTTKTTYIEWRETGTGNMMLYATVHAGATQEAIARAVQSVRDDLRARYGDEAAESVRTRG